MKRQVRIADALAENRTGDLPNRSQKHYSFSQIGRRPSMSETIITRYKKNRRYTASMLVRR
jgi:hypothetical protein